MKNLDEKEIEIIKNLQNFNHLENISTKEYIDNFIKIKESKELGNIIYCIQVPDPKHKDYCSVEAYVLNDNGKYVSGGKISFAVKNLKEKEIWLDKIYVSPELNHKGIGSQLLNIFETTCSNELGSGVVVSGCVLPDNDDEQSMKGVCRFYKNNGYKVIFTNNNMTVKIEKTLKKKFSLFGSHNSPLINLTDERTR